MKARRSKSAARFSIYSTASTCRSRPPTYPAGYLESPPDNVSRGLCNSGCVSHFESMKLLFRTLTTVACVAVAAQGADRRISVAEYRDKVYGAWMGQIVGASYGFNFEGKARNAIDLDHYIN